ncbi:MULTISPECIES: DUF2231 domain-containing protein [Sphingomonas]|uniref:DUF2231 domain-containing protein n=1 Tax=Sphingomonas TaxID=13687 RepID=UPI000DEFE43C|nr:MULTISPECIES: DUF2231 domain-containing protein [Sphingomonas]
MADEVYADGDVRPLAPPAYTGRPLHVLLSPYATTCFVGALLTDITYSRTANMQWTNFSAWLLFAGLILCGLSLLFAIIGYFSHRPTGDRNLGLAHGVISLAVFVVQLFNSFVHARDAWTSVVPTGLTLSVIAVILLAINGYLGWRLERVPAVRIA